MDLIIIAAIAANKVIGHSIKGLPWHIPEEFRHFKETTYGFPVIVGQKTFAELGKPLPGRLNIVLSDQEKIVDTNLLHMKTLDSAVRHCREAGFSKAFIIGGRTLYASSIPMADKMILTYLKFEADGDIYFPDFNQDDWTVVEEKDHEKFVIKYYDRKKNHAGC